MAEPLSTSTSPGNRPGGTVADVVLSDVAAPEASNDRVHDVGVRRSSDMDIPAIRRETLAANREMIKSSDFRQALEAISTELDNIPPSPLPMGYIAQATTEEEMHRAILLESQSAGRDTYESIETWASDGGALIKRLLALMTLCILGAPMLISPAMGLYAIIVGLVPAVVFIASMSDNTMGNVAARFQNRVLKRKAYKDEVRRLMRVAEETRTKTERFLSIREAKLAALQEALSPLAEDYATANPGKTLAILSGENKLYVDVTDDKTYTKLDRIAASAILGDTDS